jgi:hypothetical protein
MSPDDRGFSDRGVDDRGFSDRGADDRGFSDRGFDDRGFSDRNLMSDREFDDREFDDRELEQQLADSGREARLAAAGMTPSPIFAAQLRERMVTRLETAPAPLLPFGIRQRFARVAPLTLAVLLFAVAMVAAGQMNLGVPGPSESPVAATDEPEPTGNQPTAAPDASGAPMPVVPVTSPKPTPAPTPKPSSAQAPAPVPPASTPQPTPTPAPSGPVPMTLAVKSCDGGVVLSWSKYKSGGFNHYTTLRNTSATVPMAYPPQGGAVDFGGTYTTDFHVLSAMDTSGAPFTTYYYRTMAFDGSDGVIGASPVVSGQALPAASLGTLGAALDAGGTSFAWTPYGGPGGCFTWYKLVASTTNPNPSYLTGDPYVYVGSSQGEGGTVIPDLVSGQTYYVRLQAIKATALGLFVAAQTDVVTYVVP